MKNSKKVTVVAEAKPKFVLGLDIATLKEIIQITPGHIYWKDRNGALLGCNFKQAQSLGYNSIEEVIGKTDFDFVYYDIALKVENHDVAVMDFGQTLVKKRSI